MSRKVINVISIIELLLTVIMYFVIANHFDSDRIITNTLSHITFESTVLRLLIYIVPGINLICGLFNVVFTTRGILTFSSILEIVAGALTLNFKGQNALMNVLGITMIVLGILSIICILTYKEDKNIQ